MIHVSIRDTCRYACRIQYRTAPTEKRIYYIYTNVPFGTQRVKMTQKTVHRLACLLRLACYYVLEILQNFYFVKIFKK